MNDLPKRVCWVAATTVWLFAAAIAAADSVTMIPSGDATISEKNPEIAEGLGTTILSGSDGPEQGGLRNRALLKFDLASSIPDNAIITSVGLTLTLTMVPGQSSTNLWFSLHKVLQDWSESAVTWTNRLSPPAPWGTPGGAPPIDYSSSITQSNLITSVLTNYTFTSNPGMVADLQDWVSNPANNYGWILICEREELERSRRRFASSEDISTNERPSLEVQFTLPPPPLTLTLLAQTSGQFQFQFNAESNLNYTAEYCSDLTTTNWLVLTNIAPLPAPANVIVSDALLTESNRFYRIRTP